MLLNLFYKTGFGLCAHQFVYYLTTLNKKDSGNGSNAIVNAQLGVVVNVHFSNVHFAGIFLAQFFNNGTDSAARATPFCPEIYYSKLIGCEYFGLEI